MVKRTETEALLGFIFPDDLKAPREIAEAFSCLEIQGILESYTRSAGNHPITDYMEMDSEQRKGLRRYFAHIRNAMEITREINAALQKITSGQATALQDFLIEDIVTCVWQMEQK
jgi:hypothetical protein